MTGDRTPGFWWPHVARVLDLDPDVAAITSSRLVHVPGLRTPGTPQ
ncbi:MAG: hypothetical protein HOV67_08300 [Kribbellaceae bacterium]|nr:hypothetical protein [Kribbellaceae bacterium]